MSHKRFTQANPNILSVHNDDVCSYVVHFNFLLYFSCTLKKTLYDRVRMRRKIIS